MLLLPLCLCWLLLSGLFYIILSKPELYKKSTLPKLLKQDCKYGKVSVLAMVAPNSPTARVFMPEFKQIASTYKQLSYSFHCVNIHEHDDWKYSQLVNIVPTVLYFENNEFITSSCKHVLTEFLDSYLFNRETLPILNDVLVEWFPNVLANIIVEYCQGNVFSSCCCTQYIK